MNFRGLTCVLVLLQSVVGIAAELTPLPRITVKQGDPHATLQNSTTGVEFYAIGNNFVNLVWIDGIPHHCNFTPGLYDKVEVEEAFALMRQSGYNVVRTFVDKGHPVRNRLGIYGLDGPFENETPDLYAPYMENLIDFLERATRHRVYVILAFEIWPYTRYYSNLALGGDPHIEGNHNRTVLAEGTIRAKEIYLEQFVKYICNINPDLLSTILVYDIQNEVYARSDKLPFSQTSGLVRTANGKVYDMSCPVSRQACQDENTAHWANRCVRAIKKHDPNALVTASVFPFWPVRKIAGSGLLQPNIHDEDFFEDMDDDDRSRVETDDRRWPVRPYVLIEKTDLDMIDIHPYVGWQGTMEQILNSSEWDKLDRTRKPIVAFEYGAHRVENRVPIRNAEIAGQVLYDWRQQMLDHGFVGAALFTWHTKTHTRWTIMEEGMTVNHYLRPCPWWGLSCVDDVAEWSFNRRGWRFERQSSANLEPARVGRDITVDHLKKSNSLVFDFDLSDEAMFLDSPWFQMNAFPSIGFKIRLNNASSLETLRLYWLTDVEAEWSKQQSESFQIAPHQSGMMDYVVTLHRNSAWTGQVYRVRLASDDDADGDRSSLRGTVGIEMLGFVMDVKAD